MPNKSPRASRAKTSARKNNSGSSAKRRGTSSHSETVKPSSRNKSRGSFRSKNNRNRSRGSNRRNQSSKSTAIDVNLFINDVKELKPEQVVQIKHTFKDFAFDNRLAENILKKGYETPTPIQDQTIMHALKGTDVLGMANTGTGKTAAFILPVINKLQQIKKQETRALVIAPTRELAQQIEQEFKSFTGGLKLYSTLCVGGLSIHKQKTQLRRRPHVVIGTPGRLKDLHNQGFLHLENVSMFVLDEVDLMMDMGFHEDISFIVDQIPKQRQTLCFSATMTDTIQKLIDRIMNDPIKVSVKTGDTSDNVQQDAIYTKNSKDKWNKLVNMLDDESFEKILIFCKTKSFVQQLSDDLNKKGVLTESIHGDKSQPQRQKALSKFKNDKVNILVATDVAARGLDIPNVSHVINYDVPQNYEDYIHRIGRTGRAGKKGMAYTFVKQPINKDTAKKGPSKTKSK